MESLYIEYAAIDSELSLLEEKKQALRAKILDSLKEGGQDKVETPVGRFTVANKVKWVYSGVVTDMEEKLKVKKIQEQKKGTATESKSQYLLFTPLKEENE
jgi:hypothetical protein